MSQIKSEKLMRERSANWTQEMKELLRDVVTPFIDFIDSKNNSSGSIQKKNNAWAIVENKMQAAGYYIPCRKLKEQWNRLKTQARGNISSYNKNQKATGGGVCHLEPTEFDFSIANLAPLDFEEDVAHYDSDALKNVNNSSAVVVEAEAQNTNNLETHTEKLTAVLDVENAKTAQKRNKRRTGSAPVGDDMLNHRIKQIKIETENSKALMELKLQVEKTKLNNLQEVHEKNIQIKNKELELLAIKIDNEKKFRN